MNCCDYDCNQGRDCPVRAAKVARVSKRQHDRDPLPPSTWRRHLGDLAWAMLVVIAVMLIMHGAVTVLTWSQV